MSGEKRGTGKSLRLSLPSLAECNPVPSASATVVGACSHSPRATAHVPPNLISSPSRPADLSI